MRCRGNARGVTKRNETKRNKASQTPRINGGSNAPLIRTNSHRLHFPFPTSSPANTHARTPSEPSARQRLATQLHHSSPLLPFQTHLCEAVSMGVRGEAGLGGAANGEPAPATLSGENDAKGLRRARGEAATGLEGGPTLPPCALGDRGVAPLGREGSFREGRSTAAEKEDERERRKRKDEK